jgi:hypothetical protein
MLRDIGVIHLRVACQQSVDYRNADAGADATSIFYLYNNEGCPTSNSYLLVDTYT